MGEVAKIATIRGEVGAAGIDASVQPATWLIESLSKIPLANVRPLAGSSSKYGHYRSLRGGNAVDARSCSFLHRSPVDCPEDGPDLIPIKCLVSAAGQKRYL